MYPVRPILLYVLFFNGSDFGLLGGGNPVAPVETVADLDNIPIINLTDAGEASNALGLMGAYELTINPDNMIAELVSMRTSTIGESYIVSGINFFTMIPCKDCLKITGFHFDTGNIALKFSIEHPFQPGNTVYRQPR